MTTQFFAFASIVNVFSKLPSVPTVPPTGKVFNKAKWTCSNTPSSYSCQSGNTVTDLFKSSYTCDETSSELRCYGKMGPKPTTFDEM